MTTQSPQTILRARGRRITQQRMLLLDIIQRSEEHLDAEALYSLAKKKDPHISLSTVYRTLSVLKELGLVEECYFDKDHSHYEVKPSVEHYHLLCLSCGRVGEFESSLVEQLKRGVAEANSFQVETACIWLEGYCADCAAGKPHPTSPTSSPLS
jgi:Fe2+ or Zn2+ uptake regulation protein